MDDFDLHIDIILDLFRARSDELLDRGGWCPLVRLPARLSLLFHREDWIALER